MTNSEIFLSILLYIKRNGDLESADFINNRFVISGKIMPETLLAKDLIETSWELEQRWYQLTGKGQAILDTYTKNLEIILDI